MANRNVDARRLQSCSSAERAEPTTGCGPDVSVILPVHNAEKWLAECLQSLVQQTYRGQMELCVYDDACTDASMEIVHQWKTKLEGVNIEVVLGGSGHGEPRGVGYAKNRAIELSRGKFLCFLDADDVMEKDRIKEQYEAAYKDLNCIVGCGFFRVPEKSTERYSKWANGLSPDQLYTQAYTSHGPTVIMPTWFMSRAVYDEVGLFDESGRGTPEDLVFFYEHLRKGGTLHRVDATHLMYRYHPEAATFSIAEQTIWRLRVNFLQEQVLGKWKSFTVWNAGKQGRLFFRSLTPENQKKVAAFCDVDEKKIAKGAYTYEESAERPKPRVPVVHFSQAEPPFIICVKLDLTDGSFEANLTSMHMKEGLDYFHFN